MKEIQLGIIEAQFADLIWDHEPVTTSELVKIGEKVFQWRRTTTHTVVKRLCQKGLFVNSKGTVTSLISRPEFLSMQSRKFVEETFQGSLPAFIAAFTNKNTLSPEEAAQIRAMIDRIEEG